MLISTSNNRITKGFNTIGYLSSLGGIDGGPNHTPTTLGEGGPATGLYSMAGSSPAKSWSMGQDPKLLWLAAGPPNTRIPLVRPLWLKYQIGECLGISLFRPITMFCGTNSILQNIPHIQRE